jgi:HAD superfamily hydrolase (TIGR01509 family)
MRKTAVLFDFDNTLLDFASIEPVADSFLTKAVKKRFGVSPDDFLKHYKWMKPRRIHAGSRSEEFSRILWISETLAWLHVQPDYDLINEVANQYWSICTNKAKLFPKTKEVLAGLHTSRKLGLISDSDGNALIKKERLEKAKILSYFDTVITTDITGFNKPYIGNFKLACSRLNVKAKECVMVGDSPWRDLSAPKKLGMTTIWNTQRVDNPQPTPFADFTIKDIGELPGLLAKIDP